MKRSLLSIAVVAALAVSTPAAAAQGELLGVWSNPKNSVHVDLRPCGASVCGYVVWASQKAQADARRGSGQDLLGLQVLRDFAPVARGWRGRVFIPDLNYTLTGAARLLDTSALEVKGCLLRAVLCKKQVWSRVGGDNPAPRDVGAISAAGLSAR